MKNTLKNVIATVFVIIAISSLILLYKKSEEVYNVDLSIPSLGIEVECEYVNNVSHLQEVVDKENTAVWWHNNYIGDHASQSFNGLWNIQINDTVVFGDVNYYCAFIDNGYTEKGLVMKYSDDIPYADLYLMTCVPGGDDFEVYVVGLYKY